MSMANTKRTTVVLTESARKIKCHYAALYGVKKVLSAGLHLFDRLSDHDQKNWITWMAEEEKTGTLPEASIDEAVAEADARATLHNRVSVPHQSDALAEPGHSKSA